jgi:peptidoglycan/LPS O-acetylase OafA/YrhL
MYENMHIEILDIVLRVGLTLATSFLFGIMLLGYWRTRTRKMLLVTAGFAVFFVHALITIPELFGDTYQIAMTENAHLLIHLIALVLIAIGILKD